MDIAKALTKDTSSMGRTMSSFQHGRKWAAAFCMHKRVMGVWGCLRRVLQLVTMLEKSLFRKETGGETDSSRNRWRVQRDVGRLQGDLGMHLMDKYHALS